MRNLTKITIILLAMWCTHLTVKSWMLEDRTDKINDTIKLIAKGLMEIKNEENLDDFKYSVNNK